MGLPTVTAPVEMLIPLVRLDVGIMRLYSGAIVALGHKHAQAAILGLVGGEGAKVAADHVEDGEPFARHKLSHHCLIVYLEPALVIAFGCETSDDRLHVVHDGAIRGVALISYKVEWQLVQIELSGVVGRKGAHYAACCLGQLLHLIEVDS